MIAKGSTPSWKAQIGTGAEPRCALSHPATGDGFTATGYSIARSVATSRAVIAEGRAPNRAVT